MLQKLSEWASIIGLAAIVFGGGVFYQKVDAINDTLKAQNQQITAMTSRVVELELEVERQKGENKLQTYKLELLLERSVTLPPPPRPH